MKTHFYKLICIHTCLFVLLLQLYRHRSVVSAFFFRAACSPITLSRTPLQPTLALIYGSTVYLFNIDNIVHR